MLLTSIVRVFSRGRLIILPLLLIASISVLGQDPAGETEADFFSKNASTIVIGLVAIILLILVFALFMMGDRLVKVSAEKAGMEEKHSILPKLIPELDRKDRQVIKLKRGFDIILKGKAEKTTEPLESATYSLRPISFPGISPIPKLLIEKGSEVQAGDPLFFDKLQPDVMFTAPVSGEVVEVIRGEKRRITDVVILGDKETKYKDFGGSDPGALSAEEIKARLLESGGWSLLRQRPFNVVPDPRETPRYIYISCFDTAPLAPDYDYVVAGFAKEFQAGIDALSKLTSGLVRLGLRADKESSEVFTAAKNVQHNWFEGPHPAGNPGIQMHHVDPINKGETAWTVNPQDVIIIGRLFTEGRFNTEKLVAITGSEIKNPHYVKTYLGACVEHMLKDNLEQDHVRVISGSVLTGTRIEPNGHLGAFDNSISVIEEGDKHEFMGWLLPSYPRPSVSPTFGSYFFKGEELKANTNSHGEHRAFVVTGRYEEVLPMDIYPMQLFKAILTEDFERMEGLGIYEVVEEDVALCEFVCPSKQEIQSIVRDGLDLIREQG